LSEEDSSVERMHGVDLTFVEDHLADGPFEAVMTVVALLGAWTVALALGLWIGGRLGRAWHDAFGGPAWLLRRGRALEQFGTGLAILVVSALFIGVVMGAVL
jgi:hypothetical protein